MLKFIELIIVVITITIIIVYISVHLIKSPIMQLLYNKENEQIIQETKIKQTLQGMNYNNSEGWYKNCKVKVVYYDNFKHGWENYINEFISGKDVVDIKTCKDRILIVYIEPSLSEDIIIEEK